MAISKITSDAIDATGFNLDSDTLTIDSSGNVGIGTSSANGALHIKQQTDIDMSNNADGQLIIEGNGYSGAIALNATGMQIYQNSSARNIIFGNDETEQMRIDSSGNVGIGVTPTAAEEGSVLQFSDNYSIGRRGFAVNTYYDGSAYRAMATGGATLIQGGDNFLFYTAPSVSAGATQSFTERMKVASSGNVGIGTSSPSATLHVSSPSSTSQIARFMGEHPSTSYVTFGYNTSTVSGYIGNGTGLLSGTANDDMVIRTQGELCLAYGNVLGSKLTDAGDFRGTHAVNGYLALSRALSGYTVGDYPVLKTEGSAIYFDAGGVYTGYIASNTGFTDISDLREKDNIVTIDDALNKVSQLRGVYHTWADNRDEGQRHTGVIAQEVNQVMPEVVSEGAEKYGVNYGKLVGVLIEAIKELKTDKEALEARVEALENA